MADRPILFSAPMVRAILAGTKTQTRRALTTQPAIGWAFELPPVFGRITSPHPKKGRFGAFIRSGVGTDFPQTDLIPFPYGQPGDRLWVREAWRTANTLDSMSPSEIADKCLNAGYRKPWAPLQWEADGYKNKDWSGFGPGNGVVVGPGKLRPSIHMPRWASRITLDVIGVRVERLQDISPEDSLVEGISGYATAGRGPLQTCYADLWESINGPESWSANPWVWVVEFKRIEVPACS